MKFVKLLIIMMMFLVTTVFFTGCNKDKNDITVAEVTHSVFYAPFYAALENGYFEEEGLNVSLLLAPGADKTMAALLSKDAQIGLMGTEASIYVYNQGQKNYSVCFAQLTKRDGSFIVGREKVDDFNFDLFKNSEILGGRKGGMPEMTLEYVLKENGLEVGQDDPTKEVNVRTDVQFSAQAGAFIAGEADYTTLFEPTATAIEKEGKGHVVMSVGQYTDPLPYTVFSGLKDYMDENEEIIEKFTKAIYKGLQFVKNNTARDVAIAIAPQFSDNTITDLTVVMQRYKDIDAWCTEPILTEEGYNLLMTIMEEANELDTRAPYSVIVNNKFSQKVVK